MPTSSVLAGIAPSATASQTPTERPRKIPIPPKSGVGCACQRSAVGGATSLRANGQRRRPQTAADAAGRAARAARVLTSCEGRRAVLGPCLPSLDYCGTMTVYADLLRYRELFANLFRRDFQAKYKGSLLGIFSSLLNPLLLLVVYLVVFVLIFPSGKVAHSPIYLLAGLACWIFFSVSLQSSARSMIDSAELIKKVRFPRQLVALSMVATQAVTFAVMIAILVVLSLVFVPEARGNVWAAIPLA